MLVEKTIKFIIVIIISSLIGGILYFLGNIILINFKIHRFIYPYNISIKQCIALSFILSILSYTLYRIALAALRGKFVNKATFCISSLSFLVVICFFSIFNPYGSDFTDIYVIKNILVFVILGLLIPIIERILKC